MKTVFWILALSVLLPIYSAITSWQTKERNEELTAERNQLQYELLKSEREVKRLEEEKANLEKQVFDVPVFDMDMPYDVYIPTSPVGARLNPMGGTEYDIHRGNDIVSYHRAPVKSAQEGRVKWVWPPAGTTDSNGIVYRGHPIYGGTVVMEHGKGLYTLYGHLSEVTVKEGEYLEKGSKIGRQGNTGLSTGEHLHFEIIVDLHKWLSEEAG